MELGFLLQRQQLLLINFLNNKKGLYWDEDITGIAHLKALRHAIIQGQRGGSLLLQEARHHESGVTTIMQIFKSEF